MSKKIGNQTVIPQNPVAIIGTAAVVGPKEGEGPLGQYFDRVEQDSLFGTDSWEKAESEFVKTGLQLAIDKAGLTNEQIDYILAGDLLNQSIGSTFGIREIGRPFMGIFGACSAIGEGMAIGSMLIDGGFAENIAVSASSHFCAAEKQFRFPLELGTQRPPSASWTVTGNGSVVLTNKPNGVCVCGVTTGKIVDMGITDANNMGAAMASDNGIIGQYKESAVCGNLISTHIHISLKIK